VYKIPLSLSLSITPQCEGVSITEVNRYASETSLLAGEECGQFYVAPTTHSRKIPHYSMNGLKTGFDVMVNRNISVPARK
jgi:hypothetical protein